MKRRILSFVLVLALMIGAAVRPQRANAVAVTATVVAASAAAILTACGVTYWAASQTDAVEYISGKIDDYLTSIGESEITYDEWLDLNAGSNIFDVVSGGVMSFSSGVANKLLDFCRWLHNDEGIESGGEAITNGGSITFVSTKSSFDDGSVWAGSVVVAGISDDIIRITLNNVKPARNQWLYFAVSFPAASVGAFTVTCLTDWEGTSWGGSSAGESISSYPKFNVAVAAGASRNYNTYQDKPNIVIGFSRYCYENSYINGSFELQITNSDSLITDGTISIIPSQFVNVPADIAEDATFAVKPGVTLSAGDSTDTAAEAILDGITSEDGLSSTVEDTPDTSWGWLYTLLVNIADAITDGVADIKQAVLGLADSIYNKFTTVLQDIKSGVSSVANGITSAVSQLLSAIQALPTTIYSQFTQVLQDIKTGIQGIALDIYTDVINALTYVFVPSQAFIDTYVASLYATFDNHFSILSYPFSILGEFITRASGIGSPEPVFSWGNIFEPFSGKLLISAGSYNLNSALSNQTFAYMYQLYMIIVKGFMSFWFLTYLYNWFCDVFKMREADYSPPEVDDI